MPLENLKVWEVTVENKYIIRYNLCRIPMLDCFITVDSKPINCCEVDFFTDIAAFFQLDSRNPLFKLSDPIGINLTKDIISNFENLLPSINRFIQINL